MKSAGAEREILKPEKGNGSSASIFQGRRYPISIDGVILGAATI
jgi:hypothetical protein